jgi:DNA adenine methylase
VSIKGPLKYHGGKAYLAKRIVALMPPHTHYVEPYAGGLSVLLAKDPEGVSEVANDLNAELHNFWTVLAHDQWFQEFRRLAEATPFAESFYDHACESVGKPITNIGRAWMFFVRCRQSLAGRMKSFTGITKTRVRRGMNNEVSAWLSAVEGLPLVHERLKRVLILNRSALGVIQGQDGPDTLFYCDPPYLHETRATTADYAHEMTANDHRELLDTLADVKGKFVLSGYPSELYDRYAGEFGWRHKDFSIANHAAGGVTKKRMVERVWMNFDPA